MKEFPPFRLDPVNQCLWRRTGAGDQERILLSPSEYRVLDHLVEHAGQLVTHRDLLDAVWPKTAIEPQAVKSKIFHLRRVLDDEPKQPRYIETLPRRGYRFVATVEQAAEARDSAPISHLVGRQGPRAELWQCLQLALAGKRQIVFVTGEPGIGKTALVEEFQRQLASGVQRVRVALGQCVEGYGSKEAFYPVLEALGDVCRRHDGTALVDVLATHAPTWLVQFPALLTPQHRAMLQQEIHGATRERMLREICEALETISQERLFVLVLEDVHWGDYATLDLISAIARRRLTAKILLLATYRGADIVRSAHPLSALTRDLVARERARELALQPLEEADVARYLAAGNGDVSLAAELAGLIYEHTEGNPLYMTAVLDHLVMRGVVARHDGRWRLLRSPAEISLQVPESLRQMIGAVIDNLTMLEQRVLEVAAIAGNLFTPVIAARSAQMDPAEFEDCCESLARREQIVRLAGTQELPNESIVQRYAFAHALYREVLYERSTPGRRAVLHRRRGEVLEEVYASALDEVTTQLAHHFEMGGDWARAVQYFRRAARIAVQRFALDEAKANLQSALAMAGRLSPSARAETETEILAALGGMYVVTFDERAVETLTLLRERAASYGLVVVEAKALVDLILPLSWTGVEQPLASIDQALHLSATRLDPAASARVRAACMMRRIATRGWNMDDAAACYDATAEIQRNSNRIDVARALIDRSFLEYYSANYRSAARNAADSAVVLMGGHDSVYLDHAEGIWAADFVVTWSLNLVGDWGAALCEVDSRIERAERNADEHRKHGMLLSRAWLLLHAMDYSGSLSICESVLPALDHPAATPLRRLCLTLAGLSELGMSNYDRALECLLTVRAEIDQRPAMTDWYRGMMISWGLSNLWLARGDTVRARDEGQALLTDACATEERTWHALAFEVNARIAMSTNDLNRAQELAMKGLSAIEGYEAPVAAWQLHATAGHICAARGDLPAARNHREASRNIIRGLADSLEAHEVLKRDFLSAPSVAAALATP